MKVNSDRQFDTYEPSGRELRVHWNIEQKTAEGMGGNQRSYWEADEALCGVDDGYDLLVEKIIGSVYSPGAEAALINNGMSRPDEYAAYQQLRVAAKVLAQGWLDGQTQVVIPRYVPAQVTRLQAKAMMAQLGLLSQAEALVAAGDDLTKLAWNEALTFDRTSPMLNAMAATLGLSDAQLDDFFVQAATVSV